MGLAKAICGVDGAICGFVVVEAPPALTAKVGAMLCCAMAAERPPKMTAALAPTKAIIHRMLTLGFFKGDTVMEIPFVYPLVAGEHDARPGVARGESEIDTDTASFDPGLRGRARLRSTGRDRPHCTASSIENARRLRTYQGF